MDVCADTPPHLDPGDDPAAACVSSSNSSSSSRGLLERALAYSRAGAGAAGVGEAGAGEVVEIRATAAALLRRLVVEKQECLRAHFHKIPFMPQVRRAPFACRVGGDCVEAAAFKKKCLPGLRGSSYTRTLSSDSIVHHTTHIFGALPQYIAFPGREEMSALAERSLAREFMAL